MARWPRLLVPALAAAIVLAIESVHADIHHYSLTREPRFAWLLVFIVLTWITAYAAGVSETNVTTGNRLVRAIGAVAVAVVIMALLGLALRHQLLPLAVLGTSVVLLIPAYAYVSALTQRSMTQRSEQERVVALVSQEEAERLARDIVTRPERGSLLAAAVSPEAAVPTAARPAPLEELTHDQRVTLLLMNRDAQGLDPVVAQAAKLHSQGVRVRTLSLFYDEWLGKLPLSELERIALLFDINEIHRPVYARMKRFLDISIALVTVPFVLLAVPLVLVLDLVGNRGPLFFHQERVGKDGRVFMIHKFRTMRPNGGPADWTASDDERLTTVGRTLRRYHLDELPQVWNVLRRELSIVGPRPEQPRYVAELSQTIPFYDVRHLVRPGLTGWAQVKYGYGATELDALEKLQYEFYYLRHQSLGLDLRIIGRTLRSVVGRQGR